MLNLVHFMFSLRCIFMTGFEVTFKIPLLARALGLKALTRPSACARVYCIQGLKGRLTLSIPYYGIIKADALVTSSTP